MKQDLYKQYEPVVDEVELVFLSFLVKIFQEYMFDSIGLQFLLVFRRGT